MKTLIVPALTLTLILAALSGPLPALAARTGPTPYQIIECTDAPGSRDTFGRFGVELFTGANWGGGLEDRFKKNDPRIKARDVSNVQYESKCTQLFERRKILFDSKFEDTDLKISWSDAPEDYPHTYELTIPHFTHDEAWQGRAGTVVDHLNNGRQGPRIFPVICSSRI